MYNDPSSALVTIIVVGFVAGLLPWSRWYSMWAEHPSRSGNAPKESTDSIASLATASSLAVLRAPEPEPEEQIAWASGLTLDFLPELPLSPDMLRRQAEERADRHWRERFDQHATPAALPADAQLPLPAEYALNVRPLPQIGQNPWEAISKDSDVKAHLNYIAENTAKIGRAHTRIVDSYVRCKRQIVDQRKAITTTLQLADHYIGQALALCASHADIQPLRPVPAPVTPTYETPAQLQKRFDHITSGATQAIGRAYMSGGHPVYFAIAIVATVAASVINFQRTVRKMAQSDAQLRQYAFNVQSQSAVLVRAMGEIRGYSVELHATDGELRTLVNALADRAVWRRYRDGSCDPYEKQRADRLLSLAMMAKAYAAMGD